MTMNPKSATLPASLRHAAVTDNKESGGFFSRLKKRFKLRKGQYDVGVNTGECENIATVSFKKRESQEALHDELRLSPSPKHKRLSPLGKRPYRSHSDAVSPDRLRPKVNISPKRKGPECLENSPKAPKTNDLNNQPKRTSSLKYEVTKSNEYSLIQFEQDFKSRKPLDFEKENIAKNECLTGDDSAVDLDVDIISEPGYESLNDVKQRIESKDFSTNKEKERTHCLPEVDSEQIKVIKVDGSNYSKAALDDSALSLSLIEPKSNSSAPDALTSSSKSRDSGFESSKSQNSPEGASIISERLKPETEFYDEDELQLDPGYAECADAIKGTLPFSAYSGDNGSNLSSCQSLDAIEPDYAECADALKAGSVRMRISVSNERLAANDKKGNKNKSNEHIKTNSISELYANPQILFKKRSRALLTDRSSGEFSNRSSETDRNESFTFSSSESLQKDLNEEHIKNDAPPLPARNYSLYLDSEEASQLFADDKNAQDIPNDSTHLGEQQVADSAFEDFGYASVEEVKRQPILQSQDGNHSISSVDKDQKTEVKEDKDHSEISAGYFKSEEDFGYASVKEARTDMIGNDVQSENTNTNIFWENKAEECATHFKAVCDLETNLRENRELDFCSSSGKDTKGSDALFRSEGNSKEKVSQQIENKEKRASPTEKKDTSLLKRKSTDIEKLKYIETLEDNFGYSSVCHVRRQNDYQAKEVLSDSGNIKGVCDSLQENIHDNDKDNVLGKFGYSSVKQFKNNVIDQPNGQENNCKSPFKLEFIDNDIIRDTFNVTKHCMHSPVSEVVSHSFICSTPQSTNQSKKENVPITSSTLFDENSLEVTIHDRGGNCRVLRITEKEDPAALVEKRKSIRASQKRSDSLNNAEKSKDILKDYSSSSEMICVEQDLQLNNKAECVSNETKKPELTVTISDSLCDNEMPVRNQSDLDLHHEQDCLCSVVANETEKVLTNIGSVEKFLEHLNNSKAVASEPLPAAEIPYQNSMKLCIENVDEIKMPVRTNIQKVSYRSVTDSDSDDCELKLENLPKLVIDESVFDDSDSSESSKAHRDKNEKEFSEVVSDLTEQMEKELHVHVSDHDCDSAMDKSKTQFKETKLSTNESMFEEAITSDPCSADKSAQILTDMVTDIDNKGNNITLDDLNEPVHMTLEEVMKTGQPSTCKEVSGKEASLESCSMFDTVIDKNEIGLRTNVQTDNLIVSLSSDNGFTKTKGKNDQSTNVQTNVENLHLNSRLSSNSCANTSSHDDSAAGGVEVTQSEAKTKSSNECVHEKENDTTVTVTPPPRPPPPLFLSTDFSDPLTDQGDLEDTTIDNHLDYGSTDERNLDSDATEQSTIHLPLVFRPWSGSSPDHDDDAPPEIPPRVRIRRHTKEASSCYKDFMESMRQLKDVGWYWGPLIWEEAEAKLANKAEGSFLVRDSSDERYILSLSFKHQGRVHHTRIEHHRGQFSFWSQPESHGKSTIKDFIEQCVENSRNGRFLYFIRPSAPGAPPLPIHLLHPVSRFAQMRSLQHMCRFAILQMVRRDHIENLPVPTRIKKYLQEAQYYVEYLED